jgi:flagellar FliL protein
MAIVDDTPPPPEKAGPSMVLQIGLLVLLTIAALGIGWGSGTFLIGKQPSTTDAAGHGEEQRPAETRLAEVHEEMGVVYLEPITTNLAAPAGTWARIELALVFQNNTDLLVAQTIQQDILAYMRTVKMHQIEGASGFQHLKSDIAERAAIRSGGAVKDILIRTLLFE